MPAADLYCWFDTEYTTLELEEARLLQVAMMVTNHALEPVLPPAPVVPEEYRTPLGMSAYLALPAGFEPSPFHAEHMADVLERCRASRLDERAADRLLAAQLDAICGPPAEKSDERPVLAGNSVHADWWLARRFLPELVRRLHYRHLDVTAFKLEVRNHWFPADPPEIAKDSVRDLLPWFPRATGEEGRHDAHFDVQASAAELARYRAALAEWKSDPR